LIKSEFDKFKSMELFNLYKDFLPKNNKHPLIKDFFSILGNFPDEFLQSRTKKYLIKLSEARVKMKEYSFNPIEYSNSEITRNTLLKLFAVKFHAEVPKRKVLGILFSFNLLTKQEKFEYDHLLTILKKMIPGVHILEESFYLSFDRNSSRITCYCEIEKIRGKHLSLFECLSFKKNFSKELKDGIEFSSPNLWTPENEEQIFKDILRLNQEVSSPNDLPHLSIYFKEQLSNSIKFNIILVRIADKNSSIKEKLKKIGVGLDITFEEVSTLAGNFKKETIAFSLEVTNTLFYRKNYAIDLLKARQYICVLLKPIIGEFRDFNGGLLSKQAEQFDSIKETLKKKIGDISDFESLFYSLSPTNLQLLIPAKLAIELSEAFYSLKNEKSKKTFSFRLKTSSNASFIIIKTNISLYDSIFMELPSNTLTAKNSNLIDQYKYHCLVQINPEDKSLMKHIQDKLEKIEAAAYLKEARINFHEGAPPTFHPHLNADIKTLTICKALYEGLTRIDPSGKVKLGIAEKIETSPCKKIYTFTLRDCYWTNGEKVTSYDFARAREKAILSRKSGKNCTGVKNFFIIKNSTQAINDNSLAKKLGIHTLSPKELVVELTHPLPFFLHLLATPAFSPLFGENLDEEPKVFNGPFILNYQSAQKIELFRNKYYWDESSVILDKISISLIHNYSEAYELFKQQKLDWIGGSLSPIPIEVTKTSKSIKSYETNSPFWLFCNTQNPKLKSPKIRQALSYAIDRKKLLNKFPFLGEPLYFLIPDKFSYLDPLDSVKSQISQKVFSLFEDGLNELGIEKNNFELKLSHSNIYDHKKISYFLKDSWEKTLGIKVSLIEESWNSLLRTTFSPEFEIGGYDLLTEYQSALYFMELFKSSHNNVSRWESEEYSKALTKATKTSQLNLFKQVEEILMKELPAIPVCIKTNASFLGNLKNLVLPKLGYLDFKWAHK